MTMEENLKNLYMEYVDYIISKQRTDILETLDTQHEKNEFTKSYNRIIYFLISKKCINLCSDEYGFLLTRHSICDELHKIQKHIDNAKELLQLEKYDYLQVAITQVIDMEKAFSDVYWEQIKEEIDEEEATVSHNKYNMRDLRRWFKKNDPEGMYNGWMHQCYINNQPQDNIFKKTNIFLPNYSLLQIIIDYKENEVITYRIIPMKQLCADVKYHLNIKYWISEKEIL